MIEIKKVKKKELSEILKRDKGALSLCSNSRDLPCSIQKINSKEIMPPR